MARDPLDGYGYAYAPLHAIYVDVNVRIIFPVHCKKSRFSAHKTKYTPQKPIRDAVIIIESK